MAWCGGLEPAAIRQALVRFATTFDALPGRLNHHRNGVFDVIVDYAHCATSLQALGDFVRRLDPAPRRVLALVGAPGDRRDEDIRAMGAVAGRMFDLLVLKEDEDPRGRPRGATSRLLAEGALEAGAARDRLSVVLDEAEAVRQALSLAGPGDLVVVTADDVAAVWDAVTRFEPPVAPALARVG
jgi:cyanophycin synthetase